MISDEQTVASLRKAYLEFLQDFYPREEIQMIFTHLSREYLGFTSAQLHSSADEVVASEQKTKFLQALYELKNYKPIQYIIGHIPFLDLDLEVVPGVLIPRPETEELTSLIIRENQHRRFEQFTILDLCSGSGCIGLGLKSYFKFSSTTLLDHSERANALSGRNASRNNLMIETMQMNILERNSWKMLTGFQLMVSNPPYVLPSEIPAMKENVLLHEPADALFAPEEEPLLFYDAIGEMAFANLIRPGLLYFEINEKLGEETRHLLLRKGFERVEVMRDLSGKDRFIRAEVKTTMLDSSYWNVEH